MIAHTSDADRAESEGKNRHADFGSGPREHNGVYVGQPANDRAQYDGTAGRWPPNVVLTHRPECREIGERTVKANPGGLRRGGGRTAQSDWRMRDQERSKRFGVDGTETVAAWDCAEGCPVAEMDRQSGVTKSSGGANGGKLGVRIYGEFANEVIGQNAGGLGDVGGASRFFPVFHYSAKAPSSERPRLADGTAWSTVKPLGFMRWAVRLLTPPGGTCLEPFAGTFTTAEACIIEGFPCVAIDKDATALELGMERLRKPIQPCLFGEEIA
jgi:hypothetical protein